MREKLLAEDERLFSDGPGKIFAYGTAGFRDKLVWSVELGSNSLRKVGVCHCSRTNLFSAVETCYQESYSGWEYLRI